MAGKSPITADEEQRSALITLSRSRDRGEADRARAILLTLSGWTSRQIAEAFGVREATRPAGRGARGGGEGGGCLWAAALGGGGAAGPKRLGSRGAKLRSRPS